VNEFAVVTQDVIAISEPMLAATLPHVATTFGAVFNVTFPQRYYSSSSKRFDDPSYPDGYRFHLHLDIHTSDFLLFRSMLGMAFQSLSSSRSPPLLQSLYAAGQLAQPLVSVCLSELGGAVSWGRVGPFSGSAVMRYTAVLKPRFYSVHMEDFRVNGVSVGVSPSVYNQVGCIVDTGTPVPALPQAAFDALRSVLLANCSDNPLLGVCRGVAAPNATLFDSVCFAMSPDDIAAFPVLSFELTGVSLSYAPSAYLRPMYYCDAGGVGLALSADSDFTVLGATLLQLYHTVYDQGGMRVGFAPVDKCAA
jgi:hypothetical protein